MMHGQAYISDNEIYLLIKYIKRVLWRVAKRLSYIQDARCLKVNMSTYNVMIILCIYTQELRLKYFSLYFVF